MRVLFMAPLPPPITGHALVSEALKDGLAARHDVDAVDLGRDSSSDGSVTRARLKATAVLLRDVWRQRGRFDAAYLTVAESFAGNLKDLAIYSLCLGKLDRTVIHLHGGSIGRLLFDRRPWLRRVNRWFIARLRGVIISGASHRPIFDGMIHPSRVHEIPNFAPESLFIDPAAIERKHAAATHLRVLYISGMTELKGYADLLDAYLALTEAERDRVQLDFAGGFDQEGRRAEFEARVATTPGVRYHGVVDELEKRALFEQAQVFCLPSKHLEGQPISILEAYAAGCVVACTVPPGVRDIFTPGKNGWALEPGEPGSITAALREMLDASARRGEIAGHNRATAESQYRLSTFVESVNAVLHHG